MKVFLGLVLLFGLCLFWPVYYGADQESGQDFSFEASCPVGVGFLPSSFIVSQLNQPLSKLYVSPTILGCFIETLRIRGQGDDSGLYFYVSTSLDMSVPYFPPRYDLQAYFYERLLDQGDSLAARALAKLYENGLAGKQNSEKAKHLYREGYAPYISLGDLQNSCISDLDSLLISDDSELEQEQIRWVDSLCGKTNDQLFEIGHWYMDDGNPNRSVILSEAVFLYLYLKRGVKEARALYLAAYKERGR